MSYWKGTPTNEVFKLSPQYEPSKNVRYRTYETERPHGPIKGDPEYTGKVRSCYTALAKNSSYDARTDHRSAEKRRVTLSAQSASERFSFDINFDASLGGSRLRLEQALAIGSESVLTLVKDGQLTEDVVERIARFAAIYRTLASTLPTTDPKELDDETLKKVAGT